MDVQLETPMPSRPCRFCLCLQSGSVFADFDVDPDGRVYAVRVSFDGFGCCAAPADIGRMNATDSERLLTMVERGVVDATASSLLQTYFRQNRHALWADALAVHALLSDSAFHEHVFWPAASVIAVGAEASVELFDAGTGALVKSVSLDGDRFGHFGPPQGEVLYVLGWRDVTAIGRALEVAWRSVDVAIDGILWRGQSGGRIQLSAELDPPGGWVDVELDMATGRKLTTPRRE
jgi:hypothetical protein